MKRCFVYGCLLGALMLFAGCGREFETVEEEAYRTDRIEGVVVQDAAGREDSAEATGAPAPTATPVPPIKEQYEIPETSSFYYKDGSLTLEGVGQVIAPEGSDMPCYALKLEDFSQETVAAIFAACCGTTPMYTSFSQPYSQEELEHMVQGLEWEAALNPKEEKRIQKRIRALQKEMATAPETVKRERSYGLLVEETELVEGQMVTSTNVSCSAVPEKLGMVLTVRNLPRGEDGEALLTFASGNYARTVFYRNKQAMDNLQNTLFLGLDRMNTEEIKEEQKAEELKRQGEAFLESIGEEEEFYVSRISQKELNNGEMLYIIELRKQVQGIPLMDNFGYNDVNWEENRDSYWSHEAMRLGVDAQGVCFFCWDSPMETGEQLQTGALLPFPVVRQTMLTLLGESYGRGEETRLRVTSMELCYRSQYTEEKGAVLLPVWNLYGASVDEDDIVGIEHLLLSVNALTGERMPSRSSRNKWDR